MTDEQCVAPLNDRRQRARESFDDTWQGTDLIGREGWAERLLRSREDAIETATRVRITPELLHEARPNAFITMAETRRIIEAAFRAAGFEVEQ